MIKFVAGFIVLLCSSVSLAASDPISEFEVIVKRGSQVPVEFVNRTYYLKSPSGWVRSAHSIRDVKYDVRQTNSLISPITAVVAFSLIRLTSPTYATQDEALKSLVLDTPMTETKQTELNYNYREGKWSFSSGQFRSTAAGLFVLKDESYLRGMGPLWAGWLP